MIKALLAIYAIWGFNWVVMKEANLFFSPILFVAYRFILGAITLLLVCAWLRLPLPPRKYWKWIFITGVLQIALGNVAIQIGMIDLSAGLVAVLDYSMPVWVAILAHFLLQERLTGRKIIGIFLSMVGLVTLMNIDALGNIAAILITLGGAIAWAVASVILKIQDRVMRQDHPTTEQQDCNMIQYTTWQMVVGALVLMAYMGFTEIGTAEWNWLSIACLVYNGTLGSALAFFLWNYIISHMEASKASIAILMVPVVGVLCGIIFLGETLQWFTALGMFLILAGILLIVTQKSANPKTE